ncbi:MAG: tetratricopeptide repeat protein [Eubacteriales bacterium]|nr:tetratricopeptide repeat protein [Eubacteriales bacterium]
MLDIKNELKNFRVISLDSVENSLDQVPDNIRESIVLYNDAIANIKKGSCDIALIALKRAVAMNPGFSEAMNLLGLCYAEMGESDQASDLFDNVIESERNGAKALIYKKQLEGGAIDSHSMPENKKTRKKADKTDPVKSRLIRYLIFFLLGAAVILAICYPYVFGSRSAKNDSEEAQKALASLEEMNREYNELQQKYTKLSSEYNELKTRDEQKSQQLELSNAKLAYLGRLQTLLGAYRSADAGKYEEAADALLTIMGLTFEDEDKAGFDELSKAVMPIAAAAVYEEGKELCQTDMQYAEALAKLSKVNKYASDYKYPDVTYYIGKCHQMLGEYDRALEYYNIILEKYPDSFYVQYVKVRVAEIEAAQ